MQSRWKKPLRWLLYLVGIALLATLVAKTGLDAVWRALGAAKWGTFVSAQLCYALALTVNAQKWHYLIGELATPTSRLLASNVYFSNAFLTNLTPARSGEALAPLLLKTHCAVPLSAGTAIVAADRGLDIALLCVFAGVSALYLAHRIAGQQQIPDALLMGSGVLAVAGLIGVALLWWVAKRHVATGKEAREGLLGRLLTGTRRFVTSLGSVLRPRRLATVIAFALVSWSLQFSSVYLLVVAFTPIEFFDSIACHVTSMVAGLLSLIPGGIGVSTASYALTANHLGYDWRAIVTAGTLGVVSTHLIRLTMAVSSDGLCGRRQRSSAGEAKAESAEAGCGPG